MQYHRATPTSPNGKGRGAFEPQTWVRVYLPYYALAPEFDVFRRGRLAIVAPKPGISAVAAGAWWAYRAGIPTADFEWFETAVLFTDADPRVARGALEAAAIAGGSCFDLDDTPIRPMPPLLPMATPDGDFVLVFAPARPIPFTRWEIAALEVQAQEWGVAAVLLVHGPSAEQYNRPVFERFTRPSPMEALRL